MDVDFSRNGLDGASLAKRIRAVRTRLKMSQAGFGQEVGGATQQMVSDWEHGRRLRQIEMAARLFRLLEKHPDIA